MEINVKDYRRLLQAGVLLWSGYFLLLAVFDAQRLAPTPLPLPYLLFYGSSILALFGLAFAPGIPSRLGRVQPFLLLTLMGGLPYLAEALVLSPFGVEPWVNVQGTANLYLRQWVPAVLVAALIAYGYAWPAVLLFLAAITAYNLTVARFRFAPDALSLPILFSLLSGGLLAMIALMINRAFQYQHRQQLALRRANVQLQELAVAVEDLAISRERNRMARELHDTLAHALSGLLIQLQTVDAYWDEDAAMARTMLREAAQTARSGLQETRRALKALRASPLEDLGLALAIKDLAEAAAQQASLRLSLQLSQELPHLPDAVEECIYRIAQEATANVVEHADAHHLDLRLVQHNGRIMLEVRDDGIGFEPTRFVPNGHYGISGMVERARMAGGRLHIQSEPGQGTLILLDLPLLER